LVVTRWSIFAIVLLLLSEDFVVGPSPAFAQSNSNDTFSQDLAQERRRRKRRKKRRKKPPPAEEFAPMDEDEGSSGQASSTQPMESVEGEEEPAQGEAGAAASGAGKAGVHAAHEGGTDEPYSYEVALTSDFSITKRKTGENTDGTADYSLGTRFLWILGGSFELGAQIDFSESSVKVGDETLTTRRYGLAPVALFNFGNIDEDAGLLYGFVLIGITGGSIPSGTESTKYSGYRLGLGLGYRYFMDTNVAFFGEVGFDYGSEKVSGAEEGTSVTVIRPLRLGFTLFL
jgi:hypothetical protein